ncbi:MAG: hypothetical protein IKE27_10665 [Oscillospiraceae bacterium]|nr:hypothetical protein [Oscillospiraceae bacterium]
MENDSKVLNAIGMCRRAGKLGIGMDATIESLRKGAPLVLIAKDASDRTKRKVTEAAQGLSETAELRYTMEEIESGVGRKFAVAAVKDRNLAQAVRIALQKEESINAD